MAYSPIIRSILVAILSGIFGASTIMAALPVVDDGKSVQEPGVFTDGCYYGKDESQSDHAPVIYDEFGTWNVAGPISHYAVVPNPKEPAIQFFNHKFFTDENGNLINRAGNKIGFLGSSEVVLLQNAYNAKKVEDMLFRGIGEERKRDTSQVSKLIDRAAQDLISQVAADQTLQPNKVKFTELLKKMQSIAHDEIDNEQETSFPITVELLNAATRRGYALATETYLNRMERVAEKIKAMFETNPNLKYMVLQEVPKADEKSAAGESLQERIQEFFANQDPWHEAIMRVLDKATLNENGQLNIDREKLKTILAEAPERVPGKNVNKTLRNLIYLKRSSLKGQPTAADKIAELLRDPNAVDLDLMFFKQIPGKLGKLVTNIGKTSYKKNLGPDVAIIYRPQAVAPIQLASDNDNRFVPWCFDDTKTCYVAAHMPFTETPKELVARCKDMRGMAEFLHTKGYDQIRIAGDFNTSASRIARYCENVLKPTDGKVELHTSVGEKGNSCGSNNGHMSSQNIDILIKFDFAK